MLQNLGYIKTKSVLPKLDFRQYIYRHRTNCWLFWRLFSQSKPQIPAVNALLPARHADPQQTTNTRTGKVERVFANLDAVYQNDNGPLEELSFEELRASARGWLDRAWAAETKQSPLHSHAPSPERQYENLVASVNKVISQDAESTSSQQETHSSPSVQLETTIAIGISKEGNVGRPKKMKIKEVKAETQTSIMTRYLL